MRYPINTTIEHRSGVGDSGKLTGVIVDVDGDRYVIDWTFGDGTKTTNTWNDWDFDKDNEKILTPPFKLDEDLFTI